MRYLIFILFFILKGCPQDAPNNVVENEPIKEVVIDGAKTKSINDASFLRNIKGVDTVIQGKTIVMHLNHVP